jgi:hypothetical protein
MAHEYLIKTPAMIAMLKDHELAGVARSEDGHYHLCLERYYEDFMAAAHRLKATLLADPQGALPSELAAHWELARALQRDSARAQATAPRRSRRDGRKRKLGAEELERRHAQGAPRRQS